MLNVYVVLQTMFLDRVERVRRDDSGATAVEYGLLVALIAAVIITLVAALGLEINAAFKKIVDGIPG